MIPREICENRCCSEVDPRRSRPCPPSKRGRVWRRDRGFSTQLGVPSYASTYGFVRDRLREVRHLYRRHKEDAGQRATRVVADMEAVAAALREQAGLELVGRSVLDVGLGQSHGHMLWMAAHNRVVGIDLDISPRSWHLGDYLSVPRENGFTWFYKTVGRKALGLDRRFAAELARPLGISRPPASIFAVWMPRGCRFPTGLSRSCSPAPYLNTSQRRRRRSVSRRGCSNRGAAPISSCICTPATAVATTRGCSAVTAGATLLGASARGERPSGATQLVFE